MDLNRIAARVASNFRRADTTAPEMRAQLDSKLSGLEEMMVNAVMERDLQPDTTIIFDDATGLGFSSLYDEYGIQFIFHVDESGRAGLTVTHEGETDLAWSGDVKTMHEPDGTFQNGVQKAIWIAQQFLAGNDK